MTSKAEQELKMRGQEAGRREEREKKAEEKRDEVANTALWGWQCYIEKGTKRRKRVWAFLKRADAGLLIILGTASG